MKAKFILIPTLAILSVATDSRADIVTDWSANLDQTIVVVAQPVPTQARSIAIVHTAIYDAVNGIARKYTRYFVTEGAPPGASQEAAAAQAAYTAMVSLYPSQKSALEVMLADSLDKIPGHEGNSRSIARGRAWGEHVANLILAWRGTDGFTTPLPPYFGGGAPGIWRSPPT